MWKIPKIWGGGDAWIIGGGASIPLQFDVPEDVIQQVISGAASPSAYSPYMKDIHSCHVIAVNMAYKIGDWIDMVIFGDQGYFLKEKNNLADFPGIKVSVTPAARDIPWVRYIPRDTSHPKGITTNSKAISWNLNTGAAAINLAAHLGAKRIILLGFDMKLGKGNMQHWHNLYQKGPVIEKDIRRMKKLPFDRHLSCFPAIAADAKKLGITILNASPDSAITAFPKVTVKEILQAK